VSAPSAITPAAVPSPLPASSAASRDWSVARIVAIAGLYYLVIAVAVTMHLWRHPSSTIVAGNVYDTDQFTWFFRYDASAFAHLRLPGLITTSMNAPQGISVMWNTFMLLPGVILAPVTLLAGPQVSLTILMTLGFAGSATALFAVARSWGAPARYAALGGFAYGFGPALLQSANGHYDLQFAVLPPLIASAALRILTKTTRRGPLRTGLWLGVLATAQIFMTEELLFDTAVGVVVAACVLAVSRPRAVRASLRGVWTALLAGISVIAVVAGYPLWTQFFGPLRVSGSPFTPDWFKNDLAGLVQPAAYEWLHTRSSAAFAAATQAQLPEYLAYLGWPMLIAMAVFTVAFWRVLTIRVSAVVYVVLTIFSLGGTLLAGGHEHSWLKLPWYWVQTLPVTGSVIPDRFSIVADVAAGALLAFGLAEWRRRAAGSSSWVRDGRLVMAAGLIAVVPLIPKPLPGGTVVAVPRGWSAAFTALRLPAGASVLVVPIPESTFTEPLRWQADTEEPSSLVGGYFMGPAWNGHVYIDGNGLTTSEQYLNQLWAQSSGQVTGSQPVGLVPDAVEMHAQIVQLHPAAVVAVTSERTELGQYLISVLGKPTVISGSVLGWRI
jgi:hypothetical protein